MIFPALYRFAKSHGLLDDLDFTEQTIHAVIDLQADGAYLGVFPVGDKKNPIKKSVSRIAARNSSAIACLGADTANRIIPNLDADANKFAIDTQTLFLEQLRELATTIQHSGLNAIVGFLDQLHSDESLQTQIKESFEAQKLKVSDWVSFRVEGNLGYLVEWEELKAWWRDRCASASAKQLADSKDPLIPCMVTGKLCYPVRTHGTRIKVAPGGLAGGVALVSSDKSAFGSYGFDKSLVSPMSEEAVEGYIRAINYLGDKKRTDHHHRTSDTIYLFWCDRPEIQVNPARTIEDGDDTQAEEDDDWISVSLKTPQVLPQLSDSPQAAAGVMKSPDAGALKSGADAASARFYCLALSGSSARGIIRSWIDQPLPEAVRNVRAWFDDITIPLDRNFYDPSDKKKDPKKRKIIAERGELYSRWPLWKLVSSLQGKGDNSPELARFRSQLFSCAILGRRHPVPRELLIIACRRITTTGDCPPPRAALISLLLRRLYLQNPELKLTTMSEIENHIHNSRPFLCGRLFRILESAQYYALGDVNASVVDKFYSAASATPAAVFGLLMAKLHDHLAKAKKSGDQKKKRAGMGLTNRVAEISAQLSDQGGFPKTFSPEEQGAFALGFYSEKLRRKKEDPEADEHLDETSADESNS